MSTALPRVPVPPEPVPPEKPDVFSPKTRIKLTDGAPVVRGQRIKWHMYGESYEILLEYKPDPKAGPARDVVPGLGVIRMGGGDFVMVSERGHTHTTPECIVRGVQWTIYADVASEEDIKQALAYEKVMEPYQQAKKARADAISENKRLETLERYAHLIRVKDDPRAGVKNIRAELKATFPGHKFSVTSERSSIYIRWELGPSTKEVEAVTDKYSMGHFNGMEDIYEYDRDDHFPRLFGGAEYVSAYRSSNEAADLVTCTALCQRWNLPVPADGRFGCIRDDNKGGDSIDVLARRILFAGSYPPGATITGIERTEAQAGSWEQMYRCTFTAPEMATVNIPKKRADNPRHPVNVLRHVVNRTIANGSPVIVEQPAVRTSSADADINAALRQVMGLDAGDTDYICAACNRNFGNDGTARDNHFMSPDCPKYGHEDEAIDTLPAGTTPTEAFAQGFASSEASAAAAPPPDNILLFPTPAPITATPTTDDIRRRLAGATAPEPAAKDPKMAKALRLLVQYGKGSFMGGSSYLDAWKLSGPSYKDARREVMAALLDVKLPYSKCGVTALRNEFWKRVPPGVFEEDSCDAAREEAFDKWAKENYPEETKRN